MGNGMRALKIVTIVMGVLILGGTAVMIAAIVKRGGISPPAAVPGRAFSTVLDEPSGTSIAGVVQEGGRVVVTLRGGGVDRVVVVDAVSGTVVGRIGLGR